MTPRKLSLKGFRGIRDGLGRDELVLDLGPITADAQLVCLAGPNGAGKSTLLDNLHPFRMMPSRTSGLSPAGFSFYDHLVGSEGEKDLEWGLGEARYRSILVFKQNGRRRCEASLYEWNNDAWRPVRLADGTVSDGRTETYDRCVEALLGNPETFFTAVFCAQNRKPIAGYANAEIKALMVDLLGLEELRATGDKVTAVLRLLNTELEVTQRQSRHIETLKSELTALRSDFDQAEYDVNRHRASLAEIRARLVLEREAVNQQCAIKIRCEEVERRRQELHVRIQGLQHQQNRQRAELERERSQDVSRGDRIEARLRELRTASSARIDSLEVALSEAGQLAERHAEIEQARIQKAERIEARRKLIIEIEALHEQAHTADALAKKLELLKAKQVSLATELSSLTRSYDDLQSRSALCGSVPCTATPFHAQCSLLAEARLAHERLPAVQDERQRVDVELQEANAHIQALATELQRFENVWDSLSQRTAAKDVLQAEIEKLESVIALAPLVSASMNRETELRQELDVVARSTQAEIATLESEWCASNARMAERERRFEERRAVIERDIEHLQAQIAQLPPPFDESALMRAQTSVHVAEEQLSQREHDHLHAQARVLTLGAQLQEKTRCIDQGERIQRRCSRLGHESECWSLLAKALSKDGIIALSIDDVGPALSALANELLLACYGPRFSVSLCTQVETAKGDLREGFEIMVHDSASESAKSLSVLSGGERVWIQQAMSAAIALYLSPSSGRRYETLFSDEVDGPLDPERKRMFGAMKREVLRLGGYERAYFVTQSPELALMADVVVNLEELVGTSDRIAADCLS